MGPTCRYRCIRWLARALASIALLAAAAHAAHTDEELLVSPGSSILEGLATMSVGGDLSVLFEAREIFRLAHRDDAVAAIDRHLEMLALARLLGTPPPPAGTVGDIVNRAPPPGEAAALRAARMRVLHSAPAGPAATTIRFEDPPVAVTVDHVRWHGAGLAGEQRARRWLAEIGCERRGVCKETRFEQAWKDERVKLAAWSAGAGLAAGLLFGLFLRVRLRLAIGVSLLVLLVAGLLLSAYVGAGDLGYLLLGAILYGPFILGPYFAALVAVLLLFKRRVRMGAVAANGAGRA